MDQNALTEIIDGFASGQVTVPSPGLLNALARAAGVAPDALRAMFEARFRDAGHETTLFDSMPFSGSG